MEYIWLIYGTSDNWKTIVMQFNQEKCRRSGWYYAGGKR